MPKSSYRDLAHFTAALYRRGAKFILFGGDLINGYTTNIRELESQFGSWKQAIQPVGALISIYEAMGKNGEFTLYQVFDQLVRAALISFPFHVDCPVDIVNELEIRVRH